MTDLSTVRLCMECDHNEGGCAVTGEMQPLNMARRACLGAHWVEMRQRSYVGPETLVELLRDDGSDLCRQAADRIQALEAQIPVADRIEALEAQIAVADRLVQRVEEAENHILWALPLAKGYAASNRHEINLSIIAGCESFLAGGCSMTHPKEAVEADHAAWFMAEHPHTYRDMLAEEMSARVIFAHSYVAWKAALDRAARVQHE